MRIPEHIYKSIIHSDQTLQNIYTVTNDQDGNKELKLVVINCEYNIILISIILINSREASLNLSNVLLTIHLERWGEIWVCYKLLSKNTLIISKLKQNFRENRFSLKHFIQTEKKIRIFLEKYFFKKWQKSIKITCVKWFKNPPVYCDVWSVIYIFKNVSLLFYCIN